MPTLIMNTFLYFLNSNIHSSPCAAYPHNTHSNIKLYLSEDTYKNCFMKKNILSDDRKKLHELWPYPNLYSQFKQDIIISSWLTTNNSLSWSISTQKVLIIKTKPTNQKDIMYDPPRFNSTLCLTHTIMIKRVYEQNDVLLLSKQDYTHKMQPIIRIIIIIFILSAIFLLSNHVMFHETHKILKWLFRNLIQVLFKTTKCLIS